MTPLALQTQRKVLCPSNGSGNRKPEVQQGLLKRKISNSFKPPSPNPAQKHDENSCIPADRSFSEISAISPHKHAYVSRTCSSKNKYCSMSTNSMQNEFSTPTCYFSPVRDAHMECKCSVKGHRGMTNAAENTVGNGKHCGGMRPSDADMQIFIDDGDCKPLSISFEPALGSTEGRRKSALQSDQVGIESTESCLNAVLDDSIPKPFQDPNLGDAESWNDNPDLKNDQPNESWEAGITFTLQDIQCNSLSSTIEESCLAQTLQSTDSDTSQEATEVSSSPEKTGNWRLNAFLESFGSISPLREGRVKILVKAFESLLSSASSKQKNDQHAGSTPRKFPLQFSYIDTIVTAKCNNGGATCNPEGEKVTQQQQSYQQCADFYVEVMEQKEPNARYDDIRGLFCHEIKEHKGTIQSPGDQAEHYRQDQHEEVNPGSYPSNFLHLELHRGRNCNDTYIPADQAVQQQSHEQDANCDLEAMEQSHEIYKHWATNSSERKVSYSDYAGDAMRKEDGFGTCSLESGDTEAETKLPSYFHQFSSFDACQSGSSTDSRTAENPAAQEIDAPESNRHGTAFVFDAVERIDSSAVYERSVDQIDAQESNRHDTAFVFDAVERIDSSAVYEHSVDQITWNVDDEGDATRKEVGTATCTSESEKETSKDLGEKSDDFLFRSVEQMDLKFESWERNSTGGRKEIRKDVGDAMGKEGRAAYCLPAAEGIAKQPEPEARCDHSRFSYSSKSSEKRSYRNSGETNSTIEVHKESPKPIIEDQERTESNVICEDMQSHWNEVRSVNNDDAGDVVGNEDGSRTSQAEKQGDKNCHAQGAAFVIAAVEQTKSNAGSRNLDRMVGEAGESQQNNRTRWQKRKLDEDIEMKSPELKSSSDSQPCRALKRCTVDGHAAHAHERKKTCNRGSSNLVKMYPGVTCSVSVNGPSIAEEPQMLHPVKPRPFKLLTAERGQMKKQELLGRLKKLLEEEERLRVRPAQELPGTTEHPEILQKPPVKESTKPLDIRLNSGIRAVERAEFDRLVADKLLIIEEERLEQERLRKAAEEEEIKRLRREMVPKAQSMPNFDRPFQPRRSTKRLTIPREPQFHRPNKRQKSASPMEHY